MFNQLVPGSNQMLFFIGGHVEADNARRIREYPDISMPVLIDGFYVVGVLSGSLDVYLTELVVAGGIEYESVICCQCQRIFSDDCQIGDVPVRIGDIYEFQLAGFEIIAGQFAVFGGKIDVFFPLDDVTEREVCVQCLFPDDSDAFVGQYPFVFFGVLKDRIDLIAFQVAIEDGIRRDAFSALALLLVGTVSISVFTKYPGNFFFQRENTYDMVRMIERPGKRLEDVYEFHSFDIEQACLSVIRSTPDIAVFTFYNVAYTVTLERVGRFLEYFVVFERVTVKLVYPIPGTEPHKPFLVLQNTHHVALCKAITD